MPCHFFFAVDQIRGRDVGSERDGAARDGHQVGAEDGDQSLNPGGVQLRSRTSFILALAVLALGLGNFWRFSFLAGQHGGGYFVVTYLLLLYLVATPVLVAEIVIGTHGRGDPVQSCLQLARDSSVSVTWRWLGLLAIATGLLVLTLQGVVAGWALDYASRMQSGQFTAASALDTAGHFAKLLDDPGRMLYRFNTVLLAASAISALGLLRGLAALVWLTVPVVLVVLGVMVDYALTYGDARAAGEFLFSSQFIDFNVESVWVALGHVVFSLGAGLGVGMVLGAAAPPRLPVARSVLAVATFDTLVALAAGVAIFPLLFASNQQVAQGPALLFVGLPYALGNLPEGEFIGTLFFAMITLVSVVGMAWLAEPAVAWIRRRFRIYRLLAVAAVFVGVWVLGFAAVLSFNVWRETPGSGNWNFVSLLERVPAELLVPLVLLVTAILVGWRARRDVLRSELYRENAVFFSLWYQALKYCVPAAALLLLAAIALA